jgi:nucleoside-diphosphate-sugar epimerase
VITGGLGLIGSAIARRLVALGAEVLLVGSMIPGYGGNPARIAIVHAGTRQIYGRPEYRPVDGRHSLRPVDVNGVNKMAGEAYHLLYRDVYGIKTRSLRLTNVYGPGMRIRDARQTFLGIWLRRVIEGEPFEVWGGEQRRDLLYVDDAAEAFLYAAVTPEAVGWRSIWWEMSLTAWRLWRKRSSRRMAVGNTRSGIFR